MKDNLKNDIQGSLFRSKFPGLPDLNELPYSFAEQNCMIHIDNFRHVNLGQLSYPMYTRKPELAFYCISRTCAVLCFIWMSTTDIVYNVWQLVPSYNLMLLGRNDITRKHPATRPINLKYHLVHTKPGNCKFDVILFSASNLCQLCGI